MNESNIEIWLSVGMHAVEILIDLANRLWLAESSVVIQLVSVNISIENWLKLGIGKSELLLYYVDLVC